MNIQKVLLISRVVMSHFEKEADNNLAEYGNSAKPSQAGSDNSWLLGVDEFENMILGRIYSEAKELEAFVFSQSRSSLLSQGFIDSIASRIDSFEQSISNDVRRFANQRLQTKILVESKAIMQGISDVSLEIDKRLDRSVLSGIVAVIVAISINMVGNASRWLSGFSPWLIIVCGVVSFVVLNLIRKSIVRKRFALPELPELTIYASDQDCKISLTSHRDKYQVTGKLYETGAIVGFRTALNTGRPSAILFGLAGSALVHAGAWLVNQMTKPPKEQLGKEIWAKIKPVMKGSHARIEKRILGSTRFLREESDRASDEYRSRLRQLLEQLITYKRSLV